MLMADPVQLPKTCTARMLVLDHLSTDEAQFGAVTITAQGL
jgi:hypothetical protein